MELSKSLVEVDEVLKYLVEDERRKIPREVFEFINKNKDKEYEWYIDKSKKLQEQSLSDEAVAILAYINMEYLLNSKQKRLMKEFYELYDRMNSNN